MRKLNVSNTNAPVLIYIIKKVELCINRALKLSNKTNATNAIDAIDATDAPEIVPAETILVVHSAVLSVVESPQTLSNLTITTSSFNRGNERKRSAVSLCVESYDDIPYLVETDPYWPRIFKY